LKIYGADFSGSKTPYGGIYYAEGAGEEDRFSVRRVVTCDDRLDLAYAVHASRAPWGLDFPFALPREALEVLGVSTWQELLKEVTCLSREEFEEKLSGGGFSSCESRCREASACCRTTDAAVSAFSPLKKTNPRMRTMTYAGLKFLYYLRRMGNTVFPFDKPDKNSSRLYEVYPSHTWNLLGLPRSTDIKAFADEFSRRFDFPVSVEEVLPVDSQDGADAVVACVTLAYTLYISGRVPGSKEEQFPAGPDERSASHIEGLVARAGQY